MKTILKTNIVSSISSESDATKKLEAENTTYQDLLSLAKIENELTSLLPKDLNRQKQELIHIAKEGIRIYRLESEKSTADKKVVMDPQEEAEIRRKFDERFGCL